MTRLEPIVLEGDRVRLEQMTGSHIPALVEYLGDPILWEFMSFGSLENEAKLRHWVQSELEASQLGDSLTFAILVKSTGLAVGSTTLYDFSAFHRRAEIGKTWVIEPYRRTIVNTECKYLLLRYGFETLQLNRIQLKTDARNLRSQRALERIGARFEGILRSHIVLPCGYVRDTAMYSIVATEWDAVKANLERLVSR